MLNSTSHNDTNYSSIIANHAATYRKNYIVFDQIERANKPANCTRKTKHLSKNASALLAVITQKIKNNELVLLNHKYISMITNCDRRQNQNIIKQLNNLLEIKYHNTITKNGNKYRFYYSFSLKENNKLEALNNGVSDNSIGKKISRSTIYKENKDNNRSNIVDLENQKISEQSQQKFLSNFRNKCFKDSHSPTKHQLVQRKFREAKKLADFYPLQKEDIEILQSNSRREFNKRAINEILKDMARKLRKPEFWSKKGFIAYMSKALKFEKREAVKINNETFTIRANQNQEEREIVKQEKYLTELEYNREVSPEWHFKKKLASVLNRDVAYKLLTAYKSSKREGNIFEIHLNRQVELTELEKEIILSQIRATHENIDFEDEELGFIEKLEVKMPSIKSEQKKEIYQIPDNIWGRVRQKIIEKLPDGQYIDRNWLSKLESNIEEESMKISLQAPSSFFKDWIQSNYGNLIEKLILEQNYQLGEFID